MPRIFFLDSSFSLHVGCFSWNAKQDVLSKSDRLPFWFQVFFKDGICKMRQMIRLFIVVLQMVIGGLICNGQPTPIRLSPFTQSQDSSIKPLQIIDPIFLPKMKESRPIAGWQWKIGEPIISPTVEFPFYLMSGLLLFAGITFRTFPNYFANINRLLFQSGFRQKSIRDQLAQNKTASLATNTLFFFTTGIFLYLVGDKIGIPFPGLWYSGILSCVSIILIIYLVKYLALGFGGWIFGANELANEYAFIVFFINKLIGIFLLPVVVILWFGRDSLHPYVLIISYITLFFLFVYRYFLILPIFRKQADLSPFHFFIYLCTFEVVPILLLIKVFANYISKSN